MTENINFYCAPQYTYQQRSENSFVSEYLL